MCISVSRVPLDIGSCLCLCRVVGHLMTHSFGTNSTLYLNAIVPDVRACVISKCKTSICSAH
jgi:hypothetical protein